MLTAGEFYTYLTIFTLLVAAGLGFPLPEEIPIVTGGWLAGKVPDEPPPEPEEVAALLAATPGAGLTGLPWGLLGRCSFPGADTIRVRWWLMLPVCILGVVLSDSLLYGIGRFFGTRLLKHRLVAHLLPPNKRREIEHNFHRYGVKILLFARLLPGIRAPIFITAGLMRLPLRRFFLADGIYAIPGVSLLFFLAFWFTSSFKDLVERAEARVLQIRPVLVLAAIVAVAVYFLAHFLRRPVTTGDPEELPLIGHQVALHIETPPDATKENEQPGEFRCGS